MLNVQRDGFVAGVSFENAAFFISVIFSGIAGAPVIFVF